MSVRYVQQKINQYALFSIFSLSSGEAAYNVLFVGLHFLAIQKFSLCHTTAETNKSTNAFYVTQTWRNKLRKTSWRDSL